MLFSSRGIEKSLVLPPRWPLIQTTGTLYKAQTVAAPEFFVGASRGRNAILRGQKSKNLPKMAYFGIFPF